MKQETASHKLSTAWEFAAIGLSCHAISLLHSIGVMERIESKLFTVSDLKNTKNPPLVKAALDTLIETKVIECVKDEYLLSDIGRSIMVNSGAILLPFSGYSGLLAKQNLIAQNPTNWSSRDIDYQEIGKASETFGSNVVSPIVEYFLDRKVRNTVCDLGCGTGRMLAKICQDLGVPGLGIDLSSESISQACRNFADTQPSLHFVEGDITRLRGIWEDVQVVILSYIFHDIAAAGEAASFLDSLFESFPRISHIAIVDIVSRSCRCSSILPGFDYVHGLQGIIPRTYEETMSVFEKSKFHVDKVFPVSDMDNTFIWMLKRNEQKDRL